MSEHHLPPVHSRWRHADGGIYKVTGHRLQKDRLSGDWVVSVDYDHDDGTLNPDGLPYGTDLERWYRRFEPFIPGGAPDA